MNRTRTYFTCACFDMVLGKLVLMRSDAEPCVIFAWCPNECFSLTWYFISVNVFIVHTTIFCGTTGRSVVVHDLLNAMTTEDKREIVILGDWACFFKMGRTSNILSRPSLLFNVCSFVIGVLNLTLNVWSNRYYAWPWPRDGHLYSQ